jgi:hypothetical protein
MVGTGHDICKLAWQEGRNEYLNWLNVFTSPCCDYVCTCTYSTLQKCLSPTEFRILLTVTRFRRISLYVSTTSETSLDRSWKSARTTTVYPEIFSSRFLLAGVRTFPPNRRETRSSDTLNEIHDDVRLRKCKITQATATVKFRNFYAQINVS